MNADQKVINEAFSINLKRELAGYKKKFVVRSSHIELDGRTVTLHASISHGLWIKQFDYCEKIPIHESVWWNERKIEMYLNGLLERAVAQMANAARKFRWPKLVND